MYCKAMIFFSNNWDFNDVLQVAYSIHLNKDEIQRLETKLLELFEQYKDQYNDLNFSSIEEVNEDNTHDILAMMFVYHNKTIPKIFLSKIRKHPKEHKLLIDYLALHSAPYPSSWKHIQDLTPFDQVYLYNVAPKKLICKANKTDIDGFTVAMILAYEGQEIPDYCWHNPQLTNKYGYTVAMYLAQNGIQPPRIWEHTPQMQAKDGNTVALLLAKNNKTIDNQWRHDPNLRNNEGYTVALYQARNGYIPEAQWEHNKYLRGLYIEEDQKTAHFYTVQNFLSLYQLQIPQQWSYIPLDNNEDDENQLIAIKGQRPPEEGLIYKDYQNICGDTVATILAKQKIFPSTIWFSNYPYKNNENKTLQDYLIQNYLPNPQINDIYNKRTQKFMKALQGNITGMKTACTSDQYADGFTVAMILAMQNIKIPEPLNHDPSIQNKYGFTVAMYMAQRKQIPDQQWWHDPNMQNIEGVTVAMMLAMNGIQVPTQWNHDPSLQSKNGYTIAMIYALQNIKITKQWEHDPEITNFRGQTVAQIYINNGKIPARRWRFKQYQNEDELQNKQLISKDTNHPFRCTCFVNYLIKAYDQFTVAMIYAAKKLKIPEIWYHDPCLVVQNQRHYEIPNDNVTFRDNNLYDTVATIYVKNYIIPPLFWFYDLDAQIQGSPSLRNLLKYKQLPVPRHILKDDQYVFDTFDQAIFNMNPTVKHMHHNIEQDQDGFTVAMILASKNLSVPYQWYHDPKLKNKYGYTVALYYARNGKVPNKCWYHNKYYRAPYYDVKTDKNQYYTVKDFLQMHKIEVPEMWDYTEYDKDENTQTMKKIIKDKYYIPFKADNKSRAQCYQNKNGQTVAMLLSQKGIIPPFYWIHDQTFTDYRGWNLNIYLYENQLPSPILSNEDSIFTQAFCRKIPCSEGHRPDEYDRTGFTVAMILAFNNMEIPKEWQHDPNIQNVHGYTVALIQARRGRIPQKIWYHDRFLRGKYKNSYYSVQNFLQEQNIEVPAEWGYTQTNQYEDTFATMTAKNGQIPEKYQYQNPKQCNCRGETVAMILLKQQILPPRCWLYKEHKIELQKLLIIVLYYKQKDSKFNMAKYLRKNIL